MNLVVMLTYIAKARPVHQMSRGCALLRKQTYVRGDDRKADYRILKEALGKATLIAIADEYVRQELVRANRPKQSARAGVNRAKFFFGVEVSPSWSPWRNEAQMTPPKARSTARADLHARRAEKLCAIIGADDVIVTGTWSWKRVATSYWESGYKRIKVYGTLYTPELTYDPKRGTKTKQGVYLAPGVYLVTDRGKYKKVVHE